MDSASKKRCLFAIFFVIAFNLILFVILGLIFILGTKDALRIHHDIHHQLDQDVRVAKEAWFSQQVCSVNNATFVSIDCRLVQRDAIVQDVTTQAAVASYKAIFENNNTLSSWSMQSLTSLMISNTTWIQQQNFIIKHRDQLFCVVLLCLLILIVVITCMVLYWIQRWLVKITETEKLNMHKPRPIALQDFGLFETPFMDDLTNNNNFH